jgi:uncharacterized ferritin-like protein (DUF455 family)
MEMRAFAAGLIESPTLEGKLAQAPAHITDFEPGIPLRYAEPVRPAGLEIVPGASPKVPPPEGMCDPSQRPRILHALANHELQAAELFAWALLAFPDAPAAFRRGLLTILGDEQRHCRMYLDRLAAMGGAFGDHPVSGLFWRRVDAIDSPLAFVCTMGLTFENANLDFSLEHIEAARAARKNGDEETAQVLQEVHDDEVTHVAFAWRWMREFKESGQGDWEAFVAAGPRHAAERARGATFDRPGRERAGLDPAFIERLERTSPTAPGGKPR